jgi:hypothetical protein
VNPAQHRDACSVTIRLFRPALYPEKNGRLIFDRRFFPRRDRPPAPAQQD